MLILILFFIGLGILLLLAIRWPAFALGPFVQIFAIEQLITAHSRFFFERSSLINLCFALVVGVAFLVSSKGKKQYRSPFSLEWFAYVSLLFYILMSGLWSYSDQVNAQLIQNAPYIVASLMVVLVVLNTEDVEGFIKGIVFFGAIAVIGLTMSPYFEVGGVRVPWLKDIHGNDLRLNYLQLGFTSGILLICLSSVKLVSNRWIDWIMRALLGAMALYVMIKSGARGQTAFALACAGLAMLSSSKRLTTSLLFLVVVGSGVTVIIMEFMDEMWSGSSRWNLDSVAGDGGGRLDLALLGLSLWSREMLTMFFGIGNYSIAQITGSYPHIVPLEVLAEEGLVGFLIYIYFVMSVFIKGVKLISQGNVSQESNYYVVIVIAALYNFLLSLKQGTVLINYPFFMFGLLVVGTWYKYRVQKD